MDEFVSESRMRRERRKRIAWYLLLFGAITLIGGGLYGFKAASFLQIKELTVQAPEGETDEAFLARVESLVLQGRIASFLGPEHYFAWPQTLAYADPLVERLEIKKNLLARTVAVNAIPRTPFGVWCYPQTNADETLTGAETEGLRESAACYWIDAREGILMRKAPVPDGSLIIKIEDLRDAPSRLGDPVLRPALFQNLKAIVESVRSLPLAIAAVTVDHVLEELHLKTFPGAEIRFNLRNAPGQETFASLKAILKEINLEKTEYIDMTVEKKVYVKNR